MRVLVAKPGLDGHDRGARVVARAFREAGFEVIYTGIRSTPEAIARTVLEEDVHVLALSSLSGGHRTLFPRVLACLQDVGLTDVLVIAGGIIPPADAVELQAAGVAAVFTPGTPTAAAVDFVRNWWEQQSRDPN